MKGKCYDLTNKQILTLLSGKSAKKTLKQRLQKLLKKKRKIK